MAKAWWRNPSMAFINLLVIPKRLQMIFFQVSHILTNARQMVVHRKGAAFLVKAAPLFALFLCFAPVTSYCNSSFF